MALSDTLKLIITADGSSASSAFKKVGADAEKGLTQAEGGTSKLTAAMSLAGPAALAAGAAVVAFAKSSIDAYQNVGTEVLKTQRYLGGTAEEASKLRFAAQQSGIDIDQLTTSLKFLSKNLANDPAAFEKYGIAIKDVDGKSLSLNDVLMNTADQISKMPNGWQKNAEAVKLFGKAGTEMLPFLNRGKDGIEALEKEASKYGLVLSGKNLDDIKKNKEAQRELTASVQGLQVEIGSKLLPTLTDATKKLGELSRVATAVPDKIDSINKSTGGFAKMLAQATPLSGQFFQALDTKDYFDKLEAGGKKGAAAVDELAKATGDSVPKVQDWVDQQKAAGKTFSSTSDLLQAYKADQEKANETTDVATTKAADLTSNLEKQDTALKQLNDTIHAALDPLFGFEDALDKNSEAAKRMTDSNLAVLQAQKDYTAAVKNHGAKSLEAMDAYAKLQKATDDQTQANKDQIRSAEDVDTAMNNLIEKVKAQPGTMDEAKNSIDRWVQEGVIGAQQAEEYKKKLDALLWTAGTMDGKNIYMKVTVDAEAARLALEDIQKKSQALSDKLLSIGIDRTTGGGTVTGLRAYGGPVHAGQSYIVGDRRGMDTAEVFTPSVDGYIHPSAAGMGGGNTYNISFPNYVGDKNDLRNVIRQLQRELS